MKIRCLGGFQEVGRNAVLLETKKENLLMDYGVKVETESLPIRPDKVDSILLAHCHLDHCGSIPILYKKESVDLFSTKSTFDQSHLLLADALKIARLEDKKQHYSEKEISLMKANETNVTFGQVFDTKKTSVEVINSGHVPGSSMFIVNAEKRVLYTSDFNTQPTRLLKGADVNKIKDIDVLITESTYASRDHTDRKESERRLIDIIDSTLSIDGTVLLPSFAVGRAAELIMILDSLKKRYPIFLDGMSKQATQIALNYPELLRDPDALEKAVRHVQLIDNQEDRKRAMREPCIIVATSGMLEGGPIVQYIKHLYRDEKSSLVFAGFQAPGTAGRYLLDTGRFVHEGMDLKLKMNISFLDFSAHIGRTQLFDFINKISPNKVICMHGDQCERFAIELKNRGFDVVAPANGDIVNI